MHSRIITIICAILTSLTVGTAHANISNSDLSTDPKKQTEQIMTIINDVMSDEPPSVRRTLARICMCESGGRNEHGKPIGTIVHIEPDGSVRQGEEVEEDTGACQINPTMHSKRWKAANGMSQRVADDVVGNIRYAYALIQDKRDRNTKHRLGIWEDWEPSESCWKP